MPRRCDEAIIQARSAIIQARSAIIQARSNVPGFKNQQVSETAQGQSLILR